MAPTRTALALMTERNIFECQVEGCHNPAEEAHHCLYGKQKGITDLNLYENLQLVCRSCHKHTGKALTFENKLNFWNWACEFYGHEHMVRWHNDLPLTIKEKAYSRSADATEIGVYRCDNCSAESNVEHWNTRPIEDDLRKRIAELEEKQRWRPVSERLPDNWESVLTIDISKSTRDMVTAFYNPETSLWSTHVSCDLWVTHWMPLPEPPIVYGKVCEE